MKHSAFRQGRLRTPAGLIVVPAILAFALATGCSHSLDREAVEGGRDGETEPARSPAEDPAGAGASTAQGRAQDASPEQEQEGVAFSARPPEGIDWKVDEEGKRYFIQGIPKDSGYRWLDEERTRIRAFFGLPFTVVDEDEERLYVRIYEGLDRSADGGGASSDAERVAPKGTSEEHQAEVVPPRERVFGANPFGEGLPAAGQWRHGFDLADMNGDGRMDLVHGPPRKGNGYPAIFLGDGRGSWRYWSEARFPRERYDYGDVAVADFDGDGHQDLAMAMHVRGLRVLVNDGAGRFSPWSEGLGYEGGPAGESKVFSSRALEAVDWNGDGRPDLVAFGEGIKGRPRTAGGLQGSGRPSRGALLFLNEGDGTWTEVDIGEGNRAFGDTLAVGDFNGDGHPDLVTGTMAYGQGRLLLLGDGEAGGSTHAIEGLPRGAFVTAVAAGDLDRDGLDDLVLAMTWREGGAWWSGVDVFYAGTAGGHGLAWERTALLRRRDARLLVTAVALGDLGGSALPEVVTASKDGEVRLHLNRGRGDFVQDESSLRQAFPGCQGYHVAISSDVGEPAPVVIAAFAGEPTGMPGLGPNLSKDGCPREGALNAWAISRRQEKTPGGS